MTRRRRVVLGAVSAGALIGLSALPGLGSTAPPAGAVLTRLFDPAASTTTFTVDVARGTGAALSLLTCPGAVVLEVDGPGTGETVVQRPGGTTVSFPSDGAGTYRVVLAGNNPGMGFGEEPSGCAEATLLIDAAVLDRASAEIGPSTQISAYP